MVCLPAPPSPLMVTVAIVTATAAIILAVTVVYAVWWFFRDQP